MLLLCDIVNRHSKIVTIRLSTPNFINKNLYFNKLKMNFMLLRWLGRGWVIAGRIAPIARTTSASQAMSSDYKDGLLLTNGRKDL